MSLLTLKTYKKGWSELLTNHYDWFVTSGILNNKFLSINMIFRNQLKKVREELLELLYDSHKYLNVVDGDKKSCKSHKYIESSKMFESLADVYIATNSLLIIYFAKLQYDKNQNLKKCRVIKDNFIDLFSITNDELRLSYVTFAKRSIVFKNPSHIKSSHHYKVKASYDLDLSFKLLVIDKLLDLLDKVNKIMCDLNSKSFKYTEILYFYENFIYCYIYLCTAIRDFTNLEFDIKTNVFNTFKLVRQRNYKDFFSKD
ncbi:TPA: hypothetical protein RTG57_001786 [Campylobacter jejuni]|nr:hypothetical protein [Campylobacter jejuni]HDZ5057856.1 hypothetical protein [Campylobacter jejuni]